MQRGFGTIPLFLRTIHGAVFADVGNAWTDSFRAAEMRRSFGAEFSLDAIVLYALPVTFTSGVAWRHDPGDGRRAVVGFARVGRAF